MKKSEFREFVKEMFIDLIQSDGEVRDIVLEFVQENSGLIVESQQQISVPKEPADPDLYDKLVLLASGQEKRLIHEGRKLEAPNYGVGFKSGNKIKEWASKAYSKAGGEWISGMRQSSPENIAALTSMFSDGGSSGMQGTRLAGMAQAGNSIQLKNAIRSSVDTRLLDENFNPTNVDMTDILADTARTTLQGFPSSHPEEGSGGGLSAAASMNAKEGFAGTPEQAFGVVANEAMAGSWAHLAFSGMDPSGE